MESISNLQKFADFMDPYLDLNHFFYSNVDLGLG